MSLIKKFTYNKIVRLLNLTASQSDQLMVKSVESLSEEDTKVLSLERIKELIIEAYSVGNTKRRISAAGKGLSTGSATGCYLPGQGAANHGG